MSASTLKVLLTNPILKEEHERLAQYAEVVIASSTDDDTLRALVGDADGLIVRAKLPDDIFDHQTRLKGVVRHGVGLDMIPMEQATKKKLPVANVPGSNTASVVEYCLNAMFRLRRDMGRLALDKQALDWDAVRPRANDTSELAGQTLGIVGVGAIGSALAKVANALGMRVVGYTRSKQNLPEYVEYHDKDRLFSSADIVVLSCPLTPETRHLVDAAALALMKPTAMLINVSRGPVIETRALVQALLENRLGGAVLDVHDNQPITPGMYPATLGNLVLTPHIAGITRSSMARMSTGAVDEMIRILQGQVPVNLVNPEIYQ